MKESGRLEGLTAIVTGASAGIGEAVAKTFAREGGAVAIVSRNVDEGRRVANEIEAEGGSAFFVKTDVTRSADVDAMVKAVTHKWGKIDILVNGVGGFKRVAPVTELTEEEWDQTITLNLKSVFLCVRAVAKIMKEQKAGRIINFASQSGTGPNQSADSNLPYACSKAGVIVFTRHLAKQLGPFGITANTVSPGTTLTPRVSKVWDAAMIEKKAAANPMRCLVDAQDSADAALFLASNDSRHVTGINLNVNAGSAIP